jgi:hypothetical protein
MALGAAVSDAVFLQLANMPTNIKARAAVVSNFLVLIFFLLVFEEGDMTNLRLFFNATNMVDKILRLFQHGILKMRVF